MEFTAFGSDTHIRKMFSVFSCVELLSLTNLKNLEILVKVVAPNSFTSDSLGSDLFQTATLKLFSRSILVMPVAMMPAPR